MKKVLLLTKNPLLHRRVSLILSGAASVFMKTDEDSHGFSLVLVDRESFPNVGGGTSLPHEIRNGKPFNLPILHEALIALFDGMAEDERSLVLDKEEKTATVSGRTVKLTEVEYKLLSELMSHDSFTSREDLLLSVWEGKKDIGVVNVYVHYLREKLEAGGEKIIISSRGGGYKIDEKYKRRA